MLENTDFPFFHKRKTTLKKIKRSINMAKKNKTDIFIKGIPEQDFKN